MTFKLSTDNYYELLALHKALLESKFNNAPNDFDVSKSPIVNKLYAEVLETLLQAELEKNGEAGKNRWISWFQMDKAKREWNVALNTVKRERLWSDWDNQKKEDFAKAVVYPFQLNEENLQMFITEADNLTCSQ